MGFYYPRRMALPVAVYTGRDQAIPFERRQIVPSECLNP